MKLAVFASGNGSNFQALIDEATIRPHIELLVCDRPEAYVVKRAVQHAIPVFTFSAKAFANKAAYENAILRELEKYAVDFVVLAGYMRLIGPTLLTKFPNRIINLHPSLLPKFPGKDAIQQALDAGERETGVTAHFVDEGMDTGPVIDQARVTIAKEDGLEELTAKIHQTEHLFYPNVVKQLILKQGEGFEK